MKKIVTIQDISCYGKCSITAALPLLSAMGLETVILPTAVFSTHTMFPGFVRKDLDEMIEPFAAHWKKLGLAFDAMYTGYLASEAQIDKVLAFTAQFRRPGTLLFTDPAMADGGKLYAGFSKEFPRAMARLCASADYIVPNMTEACLLTDTPFPETYDEVFLREMLEKLARLGTRKAVIITGAAVKPHTTGFMGMEVETGRFFSYTQEKIAASYHGTGDIFSSVAVGGIERGLPVQKALGLAADFTARCIKETLENDPEKDYGVDFEAQIPWLVSSLPRP